MAGQFRVSIGFLSALAKLSGEDQRRVRGSLDKALADFARGGLRLHKVGPFVSLSPNMDLRVIAWSSGETLTLVYVDHHDAAYGWADRNQPVIGAEGDLLAVAQVAVAEAQAVAEGGVAGPDARYSHLPPSLARWLGSIGDEDELLEAIGSLAPEYQEAALAGATLDRAGDAPSDIAVIADDEALREALAHPAATWRLFLHPRQRYLVMMPNDRHVLVRGGPGTGKTVTLVHRYAHLARKSRGGGRGPALVALTRTGRQVLREMLGQLGISVATDEILVADDLGRGESAMERALRGCSAVLVDEGQDLPTATIAHLLALLERGAELPPVMIAFDANQAIVNPTGEALGRLAALADTTTLTYCYRSTRQLVEEARALLRALHQGYTGKNFQVRHAIDAGRDSVAADYVAALSGPAVEHLESPPDDVLATTERAVNRLRARYERDALAVVVVSGEQDRGDSGVDRFAQALDVSVLRPVDAKGREFLAGVVVDLVGDSLRGENPTIVTAAHYRALSGLYVGLTRFRDRATVITMSTTSPTLRGQ